jgi:aromatic-L-amino-acid/L-tryptophan decarboxylase
MQKIAEKTGDSAKPAAEAGSDVTLDPRDWTRLRMLGHKMLDDMVDYIEKIRERPVWQPIPEVVRKRFQGEVPQHPTELERVYEEFVENVLPYAVGNVHPGFLGWVHGGGTPGGMLAEMLAAGLNANLGGRDQTPIEVERQVVRWTREIFGFPESATGLFVTGTSMANLLAIVVARDAELGFQVRQRGVAAERKRLTAYASTAVHGCISKGMDIAGVGSDALRLISTDERDRMNLATLEKTIQRDRRDGFTPFVVVGTAGSVGTGAIDDLGGIAELCARAKVWFHVDGAFGALAKLAPDLSGKVAGIERADSLAFDFHKWGQVPYDAGFLLVRNGTLHRNAFVSKPAYLSCLAGGLASGSPWPCDYGVDLSRGFRALKTWFTLRTHGTEALGQAISRTCELARHLARRIQETPELELMAPVELNIVCFRYVAEKSDEVNQKIAVELQEAGKVAPSTTVVGGRVALRAAIVNHRTGREEIDALVEGTLRRGRALKNCMPEKAAAHPDHRLPTHAELKTALQTVEERLVTQTRCVPLLFLRGNLLRQMGRCVEAQQPYRAVLDVEPGHVGALNNLGNLLMAAGDKAEARKLYEEAVEKYPEHLISRVNLGSLLAQSGEAERAREHFEYVLRIDPHNRQAHIGMSFAAETLADIERAAWHRRIAFAGRCVSLVPHRGGGEPITVLELIASPEGNSRIDDYLSSQIFEKYLVVTEFYDASTELPAHQLVINAISDADIAGAALAGAQRLLADTNAPVINPPDAVLTTSRCEIARRLAQVPGVTTPRTETISRDLLAGPDGAETLAQRGFAFPLLLRTPGFHGGEHFLKLESPNDIAEALGKLPGRELMAIEYLDARGADGKSRKYRVMMIDGQLYPLHLAISSDWKIHYFSAEMADYPEHRAEDERFLNDMASVLGPSAMAALKEIQKMLRLDYGGIDFGLNSKGEILLFEGNGTMAVIPPSDDKRLDYRRAAVERIYRAVTKMISDRAHAGARRRVHAGG